MGQYFQLGIIHHMVVNKERMNALNLSVDNLWDKLNEELDMSLFNCHQDDHEVSFIIKEKIVFEELIDFMKLQFSLYDQNKDDREIFDSALREISKLSSLQEIVELAEEKRFHCFQNSRINDAIQVSPWGSSLLYEVSMFTLFVEGKISMEQSWSLLRYVESLVKASSGLLSISGAFRAFIE